MASDDELTGPNEIRAHNPQLDDLAAGMVLGRKTPTGISGRPLPVTQYDYQSMVVAGWGRTARGAPNVAAAAADLKVSERSVRRWISKGTAPADTRLHGRIVNKAVTAGMSRTDCGPLPSSPPSVRDQIAAGYGSATQAAKALGVKPDTVRAWMRSGQIPKFAMQDKVTSAAQHAGMRVAHPTYDVHGMLLARFGPAANGRGLNRKAIKAELGVTDGVISGWLSRGDRARVTNRSGSAHAAAAFEQLKKAAASVVNTPQGRRNLTAAGSGVAPATGRGAAGPRLHISAYQGPGETSYMRQRTITTGPLPPDAVTDLNSRYEESGAAGFASWLHDQGQGYVDDWKIHDIDEVWFE